MNKLVLATALLTALWTPALADSGLNPGHVVFEPHRHRSSQMPPPRTERREFNDPYWTPCDYSDSWSPNGCG